jgi:carboxypeptidase Taq
MGGLGYFPTYSLGNLYAAQFTEQACTDISDWDGHIRAGRFGPLKEWLGDKIFRHGRRYPAGDLCRRATGRSLSHGPFVAYLRRKYESLYGLA